MPPPEDSAWVGPTEVQKKKLERLMENYSSREVEVIYAGFDMESNGKVPKRVCEVADAWLRKAAKEDAKVLRALSYPTGAEEAKLKKAKE